MYEHDKVKVTLPAGVPAPGSLVRTARLWSGGVHRSEVSSVEERGGVFWARVDGLEFRAGDLEIIRGPMPR